MATKEILERARRESKISKIPKTASHKPELLFKKPEYDPLIPNSILDIHTQKIYFIILFLLLQAWKIQQCLILQLGNNFEENAKVYFILKFFIADSIFLWLLPVFRIPMLTFNPLFTLFLSIIVTCFTVFLSTNLYQFFSSVLLSLFSFKTFPSKALEISSFDSNSGNKIMNPNSHNINNLKNDNIEVLALHQTHLSNDDAYFKGKKNINILPKSMSYFNPFDEQHCLSVSSSIFPNIQSKIAVPLKFNTTNEVSLLELHYTDFDNFTTKITYNKKQMKSMRVPAGSAKFKTYIHSDIKQNPSHYVIDKYVSINSIIESIDLNRVSFLEIPIEKPGLYRITKVVDSRKLPIRIIESKLLVTQCPSVMLQEQTLSDKNYSCLGDHHDLNIKLYGVPPMRVKYSQLHNVDSETVEQTLLQPDAYLKSPLVDASANWGSSKKIPSVSSLLHKLDKLDIDNFFVWANSYEINVPILVIVKFTGDYSYNIEEVEDGFGNVIKISDIEKSLTDKIKKDRNYLERYLINKNLSRTYVSYDSPSLKLVDSEPNKPLMEGKERKLKLIVDGNDANKEENFQKLKQIEPIIANITYLNNAEGALGVNEAPQKMILIKNHVFDSSNDFTYTTTDSGSFLLSDVKAGFCQALLDDGNKRVEIFKAFEPELTILSSSPINITCIGQVGISFDLLFTGVPPFKLEINNYDLDDKKKLINTEYLRVASNRYQYDFQPKQKSNVEIEFKSISDDIYKNYIPLESSDKYRFRTSLNTKPTVAFSQNFEKTLCLNSSSEILPVILSGGAPFEITYDIVEKSSNRRKPYTATNITGNNYNLKLPVFTKGGDYFVSLTSVKDNKSCLILVSDQKANIHVKSQLPYAEFRPIIGGEVIKQKDMNVYMTKIKEGESMNLPIKLVGEGQMSLEFSGVDKDGNAVKQNVFKKFVVPKNKDFSHDEITILKAGSYKLVTIRDNLCKGVVNENSVYNVSYYQKPELIINESKGSKVKRISDTHYLKDGICINEIHNTIDLVFKGQAPFSVDYMIILPNGVVKSKSIKVSSNFLSIDILGDLEAKEKSNGRYKYIFKSLSDNIYSKRDLQSLSSYKFNDIVIDQEIFSVPTARFQGNHKVIPVCSNQLGVDSNNKLALPLSLSLEGQSPFNIELSLYNENFNKHNTILINNIAAYEFDLTSKVIPYLTLGNHIISVSRVTDGQGCVSDNFVNEDTVTINDKQLANTQIAVAVSDIPKISKVTMEKDLCVGDYVQYKLHGTGPFIIEYEFQNQLISAIVKNSYDFTRLLGEAGRFTIVSITDAFNCQADIASEEKRNLEINIHDKPTVEIINSNDENIQEGDEVEILFKFTGHVPFDMIYKRSFNNMKDFEIIHVDNIETHEYKIRTSLQGSYEAIELKDFFCEIKRSV